MSVFVDVTEFDLENEELGSWDGESFDPPAEGLYLLRVADMEYKRSKSDKPMLVETVEIVATSDGENTPEKGRTVRQYRTLSQNEWARKRFRNYLTATGVELSSGGFETGAFVGKQYVGRIVHESRDDMNEKGEPVTYTNARIVGEKPAAQTM